MERGIGGELGDAMIARSVSEESTSAAQVNGRRQAAKTGTAVLESHLSACPVL